MKTNKHGIPYIGLLLVSAAICIINATGLSTSKQVSFLILTGCTFWISTYIFLHLDVLILRHKIPKAPRTFKVPFGPVIPIIGIIGNAFMIWNIDSNPANKIKIYAIFVFVIILIAIYAGLWCKYSIKRPAFKAYPVKEVMAMEDSQYQVFHNPKIAKKLNIKKKQEKYYDATVNMGTRPE